MSRICCLATVIPMFLVLFASPSFAARVIIVGDTQYAMVADVVSEIQSILRTSSSSYATPEVKGRLEGIVEQEGAQVVVALGAEALAESVRMTNSVAVVYGLVAVPPKTGRANITGVYMSPPVSEYVAAVRRYLPAIGRIAVVGSHSMVKSLGGGDTSNVTAHYAASSADMVKTVNRLGDAKALLLLPDANLLTSQAMSNIFLFSFRKNIPLLGISEGHVKQGSLFAFVFEPKTVSRQIGEKVQSILNGSDAGDIPASPPRKYNLFINSNTANKMGIEIPDEMLRKAKRVY